ncbi:MAG: glycosyltransferase [Candidatus Ruminococcus intestinipullorum]|nr:glycosyltransferase [Candidatus Ruminococcus intestinipullorum]
MISVVMATYNGEQYIIEQIESIVNQTVTVDEIIICDDMSSDKTVEIIKKYINEKCLSQIIRLYPNNQNVGYIRNFYNGISRSHGEYIFLADQDDVWEVNKVERMIATMHTCNAEVICSNFSLIDASGKTYSRKARIPEFVQNTSEEVSKIKFIPLLFGNVSQGCTYCFTEKVRDVYLSANYDEIIHDYQIMLIGSAMDGAYFLNEKLIRYRLHGNNNIGFSEKKTLKHIDFRLKVKKPKVAGFIDRIKNEIDVPHYMIAQAVLYLKLPVWKAVFNRFFGRKE